MKDESKNIFSTGDYILVLGTSTCSVDPGREPSPRSICSHRQLDGDVKCLLERL